MASKMSGLVARPAEPCPRVESTLTRPGFVSRNSGSALDRRDIIGLLLDLRLGGSSNPPNRWRKHRFPREAAVVPPAWYSTTSREGVPVKDPRTISSGPGGT